MGRKLVFAQILWGESVFSQCPRKVVGMPDATQLAVTQLSSNCTAAAKAKVSLNRFPGGVYVGGQGWG